MISSDSCKRLVAGNYDVLIHDEPSNNDTGTMKTVITNFLKRFEHLESQLLQPDSEYVVEFHLLKKFSETLKEDKANLEDGEKPQNQKKNRYKDIVPFSHTRVILKDNQSDSDSTYINANYIKGPTGSPNTYIACQGPLACTLSDFWRMIWECKVSVVVMACNESERGKPKCEIYWPQEVNTSSIYGNLHVTLLRERTINEDFLIRKLSVKLLKPVEKDNHNHRQSQMASDKGVRSNNNDTECVFVNSEQDSVPSETYMSQDLTNTEMISHEHKDVHACAPKDLLQDRVVLMERTIAQFHYTTWPDHGVPSSVQSILELVRLMREVQLEEDKPILVHCSAGCGRTGTICCIDYVWGLMRVGKLDTSFNLFSIINEMRQQRMAMVQSLAQYILCHRAVAALFMNQLELVEMQSESHESEKTDSVASKSLHNVENGQSMDTSDVDQELGPVFI